MLVRTALAAPLLVFIACSPAVTIDPLPAESRESAIVVTGNAPPSANVEIRGGASKVLTQASDAGRYQTYVALAADRTNTLSAHLEGQIAAAHALNRRVVVHRSPDVAHFLAQSKDAPALVLADPRVDGLVATLDGKTTAKAAIVVSGGVAEMTSAADGSGAFSLSVTLKQAAESELVVVARSASGIESAPLSLKVRPAMIAALPPIPAIDPSQPKTTGKIANTIRGQSAPGMRVVVERNGAPIAEAFADASGAFAIGVEALPNATAIFAVKSVNHQGSASAPSVVKLTWSGAVPASKYPIVFVHGMGGFDSILGYDYFYGIEDRLQALGFDTYVASLNPLATPPARAQQLKQQIQSWTSGKVNIIAHSQGTIDARYMISRLGMAGQVASYTSIAGPHHGSRLADVALGLIPGPIDQAIDFLLRQLGFDWGAVKAMSEEYMLNTFNPTVPDVAGVYYQSYVGIADPFGVKTGNPISAYLVAPWAVLEVADGRDSDGMVTIESGMWGNFKGTMHADHITEVGQVFGLVHGFDYRKFYEDIGLDLVARGY